MQTFKKAAHLAMPALLAATAVAVSLAAIPQSAAGHAMPAWTRNAVSCHFGSTSLKWKDATTRASYRDPAADSMATWSSSSVLSLTKVSSGANITIADGVLGEPGTYGLTRYGNQASSPCAGGHYTFGPTIWLNREMLDSRSYWVKRTTAVHEIGHAVGLGHDNSQPCSAGIMQADASFVMFTCGRQTPGSDDLAGVRYLYR